MSKIQDGELFAEQFSDHPLVRLYQNPAYVKFVTAVGKAIQEEVSKGRQATDAKLQQILVECRAKGEQFEREWEATFGEHYPKGIREWYRWAKRIGMSWDELKEGKWTYGDLLPAIEGHLQNLNDRPRKLPTARAAPKATCKSTAGGERILAALSEHHRYDGRSVLSEDPIGVNALSRKCGGNPSPTTVSRWFAKQFAGGHKGYEIACTNGKLLHFLQLLNGDLTPRRVARLAEDAGE